MLGWADANVYDRTEDWPVMPSEIFQVHFKPSDFFTANPAIDVPSTKNQASVLVGKESECCSERLWGSACEPDDGWTIDVDLEYMRILLNLWWSVMGNYAERESRLPPRIKHQNCATWKYSPSPMQPFLAKSGRSLHPRTRWYLVFCAAISVRRKYVVAIHLYICINTFIRCHQ